VEQDPYHCEISQKGWIPLPPIVFKDKGKEGIRLTDAMNLHFDGPDDRDDPMFEDGNIGNSVTFRIRVREFCDSNLCCRSAPSLFD